MDEWIGRWIIRVDAKGTQITRGHIAESVVNERVVTRCGRFMSEETGSGRLKVTGGAWAQCRTCASR